MATANHVLLRRITLSASASSVTFDLTGVSGYTDLKLVSSIRAFDNNEWITLLINGATTNISGRYLYGSGTAASSGTISAGGLLNPMVPSSWTANTFSNNEFYIPNYTSSNPKSISVDGVAEYNNASADIMMSAVLWNNTAAITSVGLQATAGSFAAGSSFSLYGIANAATTPVSAPKADGGDIIKTDGTYWYHAFLSTGVFKPQLNLTCDVLQVAGGGAGAWGNGGGGGAGGVSYLTSQALSASNYAVTVGAGAARITTGVEQQEANGSNSQFGSLTAAIGGGGGATFSNSKGSAYNGKSGGSGGGGGGTDGGAVNTGGTGTAGQGNNGGSGTSQTTYNAGGGGGGAGAVGANGTGGSTPGAGGAGTNTYSAFATATSTGVSNYFAGGGGGGSNTTTGGTGGAGGGANGGYNAVGGSATANTGGGGGGGGNANVGGNGGSGIIIIRYPV